MSDEALEIGKAWLKGQAEELGALEATWGLAPGDFEKGRHSLTLDLGHRLTVCWFPDSDLIHLPADREIAKKCRDRLLTCFAGVTHPGRSHGLLN